MDTVEYEHPEPQPGEAADLLRQLVAALQRVGLHATVHEPSTRITVHAPDADPHMDERLTLRPDPDEVLTWYWSWDTPEKPSPLSPARDIVECVRRIENVVSQVRA